MFLIAGLLSLAAVGGVVLMGNDDTANVDEDPQQANGPDSDDNEVGPVVPVSDVLSHTDSGEGAPDTENPDTENNGIPPNPQIGKTILVGTTADNEMTGTDANDQLNGYGGQDTLNGGEGNDVMHGADGNDQLNGGADDDELHGGNGNDSLSGDAGNDRLFGHFGADQMNGGAGQDSMHGGMDNDTMDGGADADAIHGNKGDDLLRGGAGQDTLFGGEGNDVLTGADDGETGANAVDFLNGGDGDDTIVAGAGDIITAGAGADNIVLGDWVIEGEAAEVMDFESGEDKLLISWDLENDPNPNVEITQDPQNPNISRVSINGEDIATLRGEGSVLPSDIVLMREADIPALQLAS